MKISLKYPNVSLCFACGKLEYSVGSAQKNFMESSYYTALVTHPKLSLIKTCVKHPFSYIGFEQPSPDDPSFGKPFAWPYPSDTANPGERVSPLDYSGDQNESLRAQDT